MNLIYLTSLIYPSPYANRLQVIKMSAAFSKYGNFYLYTTKLKKPLSDILIEYNVRETFKVKEIGGGFAWPQSLWQAIRFCRIIQKAPADTIWYTRDVLLAFWLIFLSKKFRNNFFFELHTLVRFPSIFYRVVFSSARGIITTNKRKKVDIMKKFGKEEGDIVVAGNGIDLQEISALPSQEEARNILGLFSKKSLVLYAGTDQPDYGTEILRSAREILGQEVDILIVSGKSRNEALLYMVAADILVAPYLNAGEHHRLYMSPIKIKEYMALGKPIIVSDLPSLKEILSENEAFFTSPGDAEKLAKKILEVIAYPKEAAMRAAAARMRAHEYTWGKRAEYIEAFISSHT